MTYTIGSCCSGYGGIERAVEAVLGPARHLWHAEYDPEPADPYWKGRNPHWKQPILDAHWPHTPNLGDLAAVDWAQVERPDIFTGGFPCKDVSRSGLMAGLGHGTRSGVWSHLVRGVDILRPRLAIFENVRGLLSTEAQRNTSGADSRLEPAAADVGNRTAGPVLRAIGAVCGDLAELGFDTEWTVVSASDIGACHERDRVFILTWPTEDQALVRHLAHRHGTPVGPAVGGDRVKLFPTPTARDWKATGPSEMTRNTPSLSALRYYLPDEGWGPYAPAVTRWEQVTGRTAPAPLDARGALSARFVEWLQGLPAGWVTDHVGRHAAIYALGDGVVWQQAAHALRRLLAAAVAPVGVAA